MPSLESVMTDKATILCFSGTPALLASRVAILRKKYSVVPASTVEELESMPPGSSFDLVLLCHTLSKEESLTIRALLLQRWPAAKILSMTKGVESCEAVDGETAVRGLDGPVVLLQRLHALMTPVPLVKTDDAVGGRALYL